VFAVKTACCSFRKKTTGHKILLNTGRSYAFVPSDVLTTVPFDGIITGGGAYIRASQRPIFRDNSFSAADEDFGGNADDKILQNVLIPDHVLKALCDWFSAAGLPIYFEGVRENFCLNGERKDFQKISGYDDLSGKASKITIFSTISEPLAADGVELIEKHFTFIRHPRYAEGILKGCSKALGMDVYLKEAGIPLERSIAMGDSANDLEMLQHAGIAVAMGDSTQEILDCADFVSAACQENGVAVALHKLLQL